MQEWLLALCALLVLPAFAEETRGQLSTPNRTIVVLGASYAKAWGQPVLPGFTRVLNRGVGGEETADMLRRFDNDVVAARPDAVLIWGHVNDITRSSPESIEATKAAARQHYVEMFEKARAAGIEVVIATEIPWTEPTGLMNTVRAWIGELRGKQSYAERVTGHVRELNRYLREEAARNGWILLDFERAFANESGTRNPEFAAADGSHISQAGYAALTALAQRELRERKE
jgi:lysophospholipase L1-like esterase